MTGTNPISLTGLHPTVAEGMINPERLIFTLEHDLKGEVLDPAKGEWIEISKKRKLDDEDVKEIISIVRTHINTVSLGSDIPERKVKEISYDPEKGVYGALIEYFQLSKKSYDKDKLTIVLNGVPDLVYFTMLSAKDGGLRGVISKTVQEHITKLTSSKDALMSSLNVFNK